MGKKLKVHRLNAATDLGAQALVSCDFIDKSLYLDSQRKIEALTSENHKLARKLDIALGKPEVVVHHHGNHFDAMEWTEDRERYYLEILGERVRRFPNGTPFLKGLDWAEMDEQIYLKFELRYGPEKLKGKFHRLRSIHAKFNVLISNPGVTWDSLSGKVFANETVWDDFFKRDRIYRTFKKRGCKLYPLMMVVFGGGGGSGTIHDANAVAPETSDEEDEQEQEQEQEQEHRLEVEEEEYLASGDTRSASQKRKLDGRDVEGTPEIETVRVEKNSGKDKYEALLDAWSQSMMAMKEKEKEKEKAEVTSTMKEEFSVKDCMGVLESTPEVSTACYNKAIEYFLNDNWRKIFLLMSEDRRKAWVDSLAN